MQKSMKCTKKISLLAVMAFVVVSCNQKPEFIQLDSGLKYRIVDNAEGEKAAEGDVMNLIMDHTWKDSVLYSGLDPLGNYLNPRTSVPPNLSEAFLAFGEGDSAQIEMTLGEYAQITNFPISEDLDSSETVRWNVRVLEIENEGTVLERIRNEQLEIDKGIIEDFLSEEGIEAEQTEEGLYYAIERKGNGAYPKEGDTVEVNYTLRTLDGRIIDTSFEDVAKENNLYNEQRAYEPLSFTLGGGGIIQGWNIGIPQVDKGGKGTLYIPSVYGYGNRGSGGNVIPPNTVLIFEVEVVNF